MPGSCARSKANEMPLRAMRLVVASRNMPPCPRSLNEICIEDGFFCVFYISFFSKTTTLCPALANCWAQAKPAGPEPIMATLFLVLK